MTLETFIECFEHQCKIGTLDNLKRRVALLGGEPTVAKYFRDIVSFISDNKFRVDLFVLFSNLFGFENIEWLVQQNLDNIDFTITWNSTGLSSYASKMKKNVHTSLGILKEAKIKISASITLEPHQEAKDFEYLIDAKRDYGVSHIRFALDIGNLPEFRTKGTRVYQVLKLLCNSGFSIDIDGCGSPNLVIFNQEQAKYIARLNGSNVHCGGSAGIDILPDGTCIPCMPYLGFIKQRPKFTDLTSLEDLKKFYRFTPRIKMLCPAAENINRLNMLSLKQE